MLLSVVLVALGAATAAAGVALPGTAAVRRVARDPQCRTEHYEDLAAVATTTAGGNTFHLQRGSSCVPAVPACATNKDTLPWHVFVAVCGAVQIDANFDFDTTACKPTNATAACQSWGTAEAASASLGNATQRVVEETATGLRVTLSGGTNGRQSVIELVCAVERLSYGVRLVDELKPSGNHSAAPAAHVYTFEWRDPRWCRHVTPPAPACGTARFPHLASLVVADGAPSTWFLPMGSDCPACGDGKLPWDAFVSVCGRAEPPADYANDTSACDDGGASALCQSWSSMQGSSASLGRVALRTAEDSAAADGGVVVHALGGSAVDGVPRRSSIALLCPSDSVAPTPGIEFAGELEPLRYSFRWADKRFCVDGV